MYIVLNFFKAVINIIKNTLYGILGILIMLYMILAPASFAISCLILIAIVSLSLSIFESVSKCFKKI